MTREDEVCLKLGREIARMIRELHEVAGTDVGFTRRTFTFPGGAVELFLVKERELGDLFEAAAQKHYKVESVTPRSQQN